MSSFVVLSVPALSVFAAVVVTAVIIETRTGRIPNWLNLAGLIGGLTIAGVSGNWGPHVFGLITAICVGLTLYAVGAAEAGYAKLTFAVGTILGPALPAAAALVNVVVVSLYGLFRPANVPAEIQYETEQQPRQEFLRGSLVVAIGGTGAIVAALGPMI